MDLSSSWISHDSNNANPFLGLPVVVVDNILDYLHMNGLKNLRLTCHVTKLWIDRPRYLRKLPLYIKNEERLSGLLANSSSDSSNTGTGWTHATIPTPMLSQPQIPLFFKAYNPSLESVKIGHDREVELDRRIPSPPCTGYLIDNVLCHLGPNLRSLRLHGNFGLGEERVDRPSAWASRMSSTMSNLRLPNLLLLEFVAVNSASKVNPFVAALLKMCPNLTTLNLPIMSWDRYPRALALGALKQLRITLIPELHPLIAYLKNMTTRTSPAQRVGRVSVELSFDMEHLHWQPIAIDRRTLLELTEACRPLGGKLFNVPDMALPTQTQARLLAPQQLASLNTTVASVLCRWTLSSIQSSVYVPPEAKIVVRCTYKFSEADRRNMPTFQLNGSLNISSIGVLGICIVYRMIQGTENLNRQLFRVYRPTVEHLHLGVHDDRRLMPTIASNLQTSFPNLKVVRLNFSPECDSANQIVIRLPSTVQEIRVSDSSIDNFCFLGGHLGGEDFAPLHVRLPNLTHLTLNRCGMSALSNNIFESTINYMSLKVFCLIPTRSRSCEITFQDGLSWLIRGSLKDSLEKLECFIPPDSSEEEMTTHFSGFHRLRTCCLLDWTPPPPRRQRGGVF